jgi:endothelin-converting enzyme
MGSRSYSAEFVALNYCHSNLNGADLITIISPTKSPDIFDPTVLEHYYQLVNVSSDSFFHNALSMTRFAVDDEWSALGKPVDRNQWDMTVPTVNAYYNPPGNEIV